ncbi:MAG: SDR family NAD(P)-dependent oxidoreductase [Pseudomonadota bacterium]
MGTRTYGSLVLTGASGGIGRALAADYAAPGVTMLLLGRDAARLADAAAVAAARGAQVQTAAMDVRDAAAMAQVLTAFDDFAPVGTVIANAGQAAGAEAGAALPERPGTLARLVAVNLVGVAHTVEPLLPRMTGRGAGRIGLVGSLAGVLPQAALPGYSASKAGLAAWGLAMRAALKGSGVTVTLVEPGFVTSPMSARHHGPRPQECEAAWAAHRIAQAVGRGQRRLRFPLGLATLAAAGAVLPGRLGDWAIAALPATVAPSPDR